MSYLTYVIVGRPTVLPPTFSFYTGILPVNFFYYLYTTYTLFSQPTSQQYSLFHRLTLFQYLIYIINCHPHNPDPTPLFQYACPPPPATTFGHFTLYSIALALISDGRLAYFFIIPLCPNELRILDTYRVCSIHANPGPL